MPDALSCYKTMQETHNWSVGYKQAKRELDGIFKNDDHREITRYFNHATADAGDKPLPTHIAKRLIKYLKDQKKQENKNTTSASRLTTPMLHSRQEWLEKVVQDQLKSMPPYRPRHQYFLEYAMRHMPGDLAVDIYHRVLEKAEDHKNLDVRLSSPTLVHLADRLTMIKTKEDYFEAKAGRDKRGVFTKPDDGEAWTDTIEYCLNDINTRLARENRSVAQSKTNLINIKRDPAKNAMLAKKDKAVSNALQKVIELQNNIEIWNRKELTSENEIEPLVQSPVMAIEKTVLPVNKIPQPIVNQSSEPPAAPAENSDKPSLFHNVIAYFKDNLGDRFVAAGRPVQAKKASKIENLLNQAGEFIAEIIAPTVGGAPVLEEQKRQDKAEPIKEQMIVSVPQKRIGKITRKL